MSRRTETEAQPMPTRDLIFLNQLYMIQAISAEDYLEAVLNDFIMFT